MAGKKRTPFEKSTHLQREFERQLRKVGREVGRIVEGSHDKPRQLRESMEAYVKLLRPWAERKSEEILHKVNKQDFKAWQEATKEMGRGIALEMRSQSFVGVTFRNLVKAQTDRITNLPIEAAERVEYLMIQAMQNSTRAAEIAKDIARSGDVSESRATLIARTGITAAATALTEARALSIGSDGYIWRTANDPRVRHSHALMEGEYVAWNNPPKLDGMIGHAGTLPNCRCYPEPTIPRRFTSKRETE